MVPLIKHLVHALLFDELAVRRWSRGFLLWLATIAGQVVVDPEAALEWTGKEWALRLAVAALAGSAGLINLGERNPREPAKE